MCFFAILGVFGRLGASKDFLVVLRERRVDFLGPTTSFVLSRLFFSGEAERLVAWACNAGQKL